MPPRPRMEKPGPEVSRQGLILSWGWAELLLVLVCVWGGGRGAWLLACFRKVDLGHRGLGPETLVPGPHHLDDGPIAKVCSSSQEAGSRGL